MRKGASAPKMAMTQVLFMAFRNLWRSSSKPNANMMNMIPHSPMCSMISLCSGRMAKFPKKAPISINQSTSTTLVLWAMIFESATTPIMMLERA